MNRKELLSTLTLVSRALASDNLLPPIFRCFCFTGGNVYASNDQLAIMAPCPDGETFAVNGQTLLGLLENSSADEVEFTLVEQNCLIKAGRSRFKLPYFPKSEYLFAEPKEKPLGEFAIRQIEVGGLTACLNTVSRDNTAPALMGVFLHGPQHMLYSCDGDALTRFDLGKKQTHPAVALLPTAFCETVLKIIAEVGTENSSLEISNSWVKAVLEQGYVCYARLTANPTPLDHAGELKKSMRKPPSWVPVPDELNAALSRARVVADPETAPTFFKVEQGKLRINTLTSNGEVKDVVNLKHPDTEAKVNAALVQRALALCTEMSIFDNCTVYKNGGDLLIVISNMGS